MSTTVLGAAENDGLHRVLNRGRGGEMGEKYRIPNARSTDRRCAGSLDTRYLPCYIVQFPLNRWLYVSRVETVHHTMPRNIELKATVDSIGALVPTAAGLADSGPVEIAQDD